MVSYSLTWFGFQMPKILDALILSEAQKDLQIISEDIWYSPA